MTLNYQINSLYLHFPHCRHLCNYCDFFKSVPNDFDEAREVFQERLERQWQLQAEWFEKLGYSFEDLDTLYFGGGTPSLWDAAGAKWFTKFMPGKIKLAQNSEWTMEVNPAAWSEQGLSAWEELGVNRFSIGVQSYDERYLKVLDRVHSLHDVELLLKRMKDKRFSVDLMLGLPFSDEWKRDLKGEINKLVDSGAEHFSVYILTVKDNYRHYKDLPCEEAIEAEYKLTSELLTTHGFDHYEVSNFAKAGCQARHNLRYWNGQSVAALGPSAVGYLADTGHRYKWKPHQDNYDIEELDQEAINLEKIYLSLRLSSGIPDFKKSVSVAELARYQELCDRWQKAGWLKEAKDENDLCLSSLGFLMMDSVVNDLLNANLIK